MWTLFLLFRTNFEIILLHTVFGYQGRFVIIIYMNRTKSLDAKEYEQIDYILGHMIFATSKQYQVALHY